MTPSDLHLGGKTVSVSMLGTFWRCPRLFYWTYLHNYADGHGIEPKYTGSPLIVGSGVHIGLAAYYGESGFRKGERLRPDDGLACALIAARVMFNARRDEFESDERWAADLAEAERILRGYPVEYAREWPDMQPLTIEETYSLELASGHVLSVRPDMVAENYGHLVTVEHKVVGANRVASTIGAAGLGAQGLAQAAVLRSHGVATNGMLLNILVRGDYRKLKAGASYTKPSRGYQREVIPFPNVSVDGILRLASDTCLRIVSAVEAWNGLQNTYGHTALQAAERLFPMAGLFSGQCHIGFRPCDMASLCNAPGREAATLPVNFRKRSYKSDTPIGVTE